MSIITGESRKSIVGGPPNLACEGGLEARTRKDVPFEELWGLNAVELPRQLFGGR